MPNWCNNTVEIYHDDPAMLERVRKAFKEGRLLDEFIPVPKELQIVAGSVGDANDPEQIKLVEQTELNLITHGYGNWYDFCVNEWGTKWDVGADGAEAQDINGGLILSFDSAWSPPCAAYEKLLDMGFRVYATYYESGMCYCGIWDNGNDIFFEYGGMSAAEARAELPVELDEAYGISEYLDECEAQEEGDE